MLAVEQSLASGVRVHEQNTLFVFFVQMQFEASAKGESRSTKGERFTFLALLNLAWQKIKGKR